MGNGLFHSPDYTQGGVDGLVTTFAVINGAISAGMRLNAVIILGIINILADGFSIACSKYLSAKTEEDIAKKKDPGFKRYPSPLSSAITVFFSFAIAGMIPLIPLVMKYYTHGNVVYREKSVFDAFSDTYFVMMFTFTLLSLFLLGYVKGSIDGYDPRKTGMEVLTIGSIATMIAMFVGSVFHNVTKK